MTQWEYTHIQAHTNDVPRMMEAANEMGARGWEVVGVTSADRTVGMNTNVLILKREIVPPAAPTSADEWQPDPCGRFDKRRWDGRVWTAQAAMMDAKTRHIDPPQTIPS